MRNVIIIIYDYYPYPSANTICIEKIIEKLKLSGYKIGIVCVKPDKKLPDYEIFNDADVYRIVNNYDLVARWLRFFSAKSSSKLRWNIHRYLAKLFSMINQNELEGFISKWSTERVTNKILEINNEKKIDKLITVSLPFVTNIIGYKVKKKLPNIEWIAYELDPFTDNYTLRSDKELRKKLELKLFYLADKIISTEGIVEENNLHYFRKDYLKKTSTIPLPNLTNNIRDRNNCSVEFNEDRINIVFTGYFYGSTIRSPEYMLRFLKKLDNKDIVVHIFGGGCNELLREYKVFFGARLKLYGPTEKEICDIVINNANLLLNIGNNIPNQTPSKVFEYIGTGKPIINFYYIDNDTSLKYLNKYPLSYNIKINSEINEITLKNFNNFCLTKKNERLNWDDISKNMGELTSEIVVKKIIEIVE